MDSLSYTERKNPMLRSLYVVQSQIISLGDEHFHSHGSLRKSFRPIFESTTCFQDNRLSIYDYYRVNGEPYSIKPRKGYPVTNAPFIRNLGQVCFNTKQALYENKAYHRENLAVMVSGRSDYWSSNKDFEISEDNLNSVSFFGYNPDIEDQRMNYLYFELRPPLLIDILSNGKTVAKGKLFIHFHPSGYIGLHLAVSFKDYLLNNSNNILQLIKETRPGRRGNTWLWKSRLGVFSLQELITNVSMNISKSMYEDGTELNVNDTAWNSSVSVVSNENIKDIKTGMFRESPIILKMNSNIGEVVVKEEMLSSSQGNLFHYNPLRKRQSVLHSFWRIMHIHEFVLLKSRIYKDYYRKIRHNNTQVTEKNLQQLIQPANLNMENDLKRRRLLNELDRIIQGADPFYRAAYSVIGKGYRLEENRIKLKDAIREWGEKLHRENMMEQLTELSQFGGDTYINHGQVAAMGRSSVSYGNEFTLRSGPCEPGEWKSEYLNLLKDVIKVLDGRPKDIYRNWPEVVVRIQRIIQAGEHGSEEALQQTIGIWKEWVQSIDKDERKNYAESIDSITKSPGLKKFLNLHKKIKF